MRDPERCPICGGKTNKGEIYFSWYCINHKCVVVSYNVFDHTRTYDIFDEEIIVKDETDITFRNIIKEKYVYWKENDRYLAEILSRCE